MIDIMMKKNVKDQIDSLGEKDVFIKPDLGTITSADGRLTAHFEHRVAVSSDGPVVLTILGEREDEEAGPLPPGRTESASV
jgi:methionine aminopeptidase